MVPPTGGMGVAGVVAFGVVAERGVVGTGRLRPLWAAASGANRVYSMSVRTVLMRATEVGSLDMTVAERSAEGPDDVDEEEEEEVDVVCCCEAVEARASCWGAAAAVAGRVADEATKGRERRVSRESAALGSIDWS